MKVSISYTAYIPYKSGVMVDTYELAKYIDDVTWNCLSIEELMDYLSANIDDTLKELGYINDIDFLSPSDITLFKQAIFPQIEKDLEKIKTDAKSEIDPELIIPQTLN